MTESVAKSIFQNQILEQYKSFRQNPCQFLGIPQNVNTNPRTLFEQMTGQKIPQEYENNPYGYLQSMASNMPQQQSNPLLAMAQLFYSQNK